MTKVWYCSTCGYEVGFRGRCHQCGQRLDPSPLSELEPGADEDEVGYRLDDWADDARGRMIVELIDAGISHRFEDDELVVDVADEEQVDQLVATLTGAPLDEDDGDDLDGVQGGDDDEGSEEASSDWGEPSTEVIQLEAAAARLSIDPTDMEADSEVAEASTAVFMADDPPWAEADTWAAVGRVTRRLMAALGSEDALEEEIRTQAGILARLLGPIVHPAPAVEGTAADKSGRPGSSAAVGAGANGSEPGPGRGDALAPADGAGGELDTDGDAGGGITGSGVSGSGDEGGGVSGSGVTGSGDEGADEVPVGPGGSVVSGKRTETVYELGEWLPEQRAELALLLDREGISHSWDTENLVVASEREDDVEAVLDRIEAVDDPDADEEATYRALEELFAATDRLVGAPADRTRGNEVVRAVVVADGPTPVGLDDAQWWQIRQRARILADSIEHRAQTDVVLGEARTLRDLLRDLV